MQCFLSFRNADAYGDFKGNRDLVLLSVCQNDITAHLQRCHLSKGGINSEGELIMMRAGLLYPTEQQFQTMFVFKCTLSLFPLEQVRLMTEFFRITDSAIHGIFSLIVPFAKIKMIRNLYQKPLQKVFERLFGLLFFLAICNSCRKRHNEKLKEYQPACLERDDTQADGLRLPR